MSNEAISEYLQEAGHRNISVYVETKVLKIFLKDKIDLIVLDIILPTMSGIMILNVVRKTNQIPIIMLTVTSLLIAMQNLIIWLIAGRIVVSVSMLILILSMWIKQHEHEIGILLSVGIPKSRIFYNIEVLLIEMVAFGLFFFTSNLISQKVTDLIFHQRSESQPLYEIELPDDGTEYLDIKGPYILCDTFNMETIETIIINISLDYLLYIYIWGLCL